MVFMYHGPGMSEIAIREKMNGTESDGAGQNEIER